MRIRSKFASVASPSQEDLLERVFPSPTLTAKEPANEASFDKPQTLWALRSVQTPQGRAIGIRLTGDVLKVGIAHAGTVRWVSAKTVLTERQAAQWAKEGQFYKA